MEWAEGSGQKAEAGKRQKVLPSSSYSLPPTAYSLLVPANCVIEVFGNSVRGT